MHPFFILSNVTKPADELQRDFEKVRSYAWQWIMHFDVDETEEMIFSRKKLKLIHPPLHLGPEVIATTPEHKHLGATLDSKINFESHIREAIMQARRA